MENPAHPPELIRLPDGLLLQRRSLAATDVLNAAILANLEHLRPWMGWAQQAPSLADTEQSGRKSLTAWDRGTDFAYVITPDGSDVVIGCCGLHSLVDPRALEIGYWIDHRHLRRGIATRAASALASAAFAVRDIHRVEIHCDEANHRSAAVPRRLGYRLDRIEADEAVAPMETGRSMVWTLERAAHQAAAMGATARSSAGG